MQNVNWNPGMNKLARAINGRARQFSDDVKEELVLDFGEIKDNWSLLTNSFPIEIPKGNYRVCRHICGQEYDTDHAGEKSHAHRVAPPALEKGDRVLVAWVAKEPVVIDVIWSSDRL
jgi:hypothetical protein